MDIVNPLIDSYLNRLLPERAPVFIEMEKRAHREDFPAVGPQVGVLLELLARAVGAKYILELGSGFGYSGLWLAKALPPDGKIILTDLEEKNRKLAEKNFKRLGMEELLDFRVENAMQVLTEEPGPFDIIYNDVDKEDYVHVLELAHPRLRKGGLFISDNSLWEGKVTEEEPDEVTRHIQEFNRRLAKHQGFLAAQIPLRDGLAVAIKV